MSIFRWGLWSPNDRAWDETTRQLWLSASEAEELPAPAIPLRIHQVWLGSEPIPDDCQRMMRTWQRVHPEWEYQLWRDADADAILLPGRGAAAFREARNPAEKSDILRLAIVLQHGGLYVDVDFECLQPFDRLHRLCSFYTGLSNVGAFEINNGLLAACPGHPLLRFLCDHIAHPWPEWGQEDVDPGEAVAHQLAASGFLADASALREKGPASFLATTGPGFFTRAVMRGIRGLPEELAAPVAVCPPELFYPLSNRDRGDPEATEVAQGASGALAVHHWRGTWKKQEGLPDGPGRSASLA